MKGSSKLRNNEELQEAFDGMLDKFEDGLGMPQKMSLAFNDFERIMQMDKRDVQKLSAEECGLDAWTLLQFSFHLQRAINREQARVDWCQERILKVTASIIQDVRGYGLQEKLTQAISQHDSAQKLKAMQVGAQAKVTRLSYLSNKLESMAKCLMNMKQRKMNRGESD